MVVLKHTNERSVVDRHYFIANSTSCTEDRFIVKTVNFMPYCCQKYWIRYFETVYETDQINHFWSVKNSREVLIKFKSKSFMSSKLSTYDFSTLYTTLPHHFVFGRYMCVGAGVGVGGLGNGGVGNTVIAQFDKILGFKVISSRQQLS